MSPLGSSVFLSADVGEAGRDPGAELEPGAITAAPDGPVVLGDVTFSDSQQLVKFWVNNPESEPLTVHLTADVTFAKSVFFQLHNESYELSASHLANLIFTEADHVEFVTVPARKRLPVVFVFLPEPEPHHRLPSFQPIEGHIQASINGTDPGVITNIVATLPVSGRICDSVIARENAEDGAALVFDQSLVGRTYVKDFSIQNKSEIPTTVKVWHEALPFIQFVDYESSEPILHDEVYLDSFANKRIRVTFAPLGPMQEKEHPLELINVRNPRRPITVRVVASATFDMPSDGLLLSCGSELHFDDCYVGTPLSRRLQIQNTTSSRTEVTLSTSDIPSPGSVHFDLVADWLSSEWPQKLLKDPLTDNPDEERASERGDEQTAPNSPRDNYQSPRTEFAQALSYSSTTPLPSPGASQTESTASNAILPPSPSATAPMKEAERRNRVEEISLKPGQTKTLRVWFVPAIPEERRENSQFPKGSLHPFGFKLHFRSRTVVSKTVFCQSRVCESLISINQPSLDLGECSIHTQKNIVLQIRNLSSLPASVDVRIDSSSVTIPKKEISIPARQTYDCLLSYVPRKVNNDYNKLITFVNRRNKDDETTFLLRATVVDRNRVSLHALFYRILSPLVTNEVDFGNAVEGRPALRPFRVRNMTSKPIKLTFEPPPGMALFTPHGQSSGFEPVTEVSQKNDKPSREKNETVEDLIVQLDTPSAPAFFSDSHSEREWVESQLRPMVCLHKAVKDGLIRRITEVLLEGDEERVLFSTFAPISGRRITRMRNVQATLLIRLAEYDNDILDAYIKAELRTSLPMEEKTELTIPKTIPPRQVSVVCKICRTELALDQQRLNFGPVSTDDRKEKVLVIHNRSEANLLFSINKTQTVASGDVQFQSEQVLSMIRPFDSKQIPFVFAPRFPGEFSETLSVANLLDARDVQEVKIKARVFRVQKFQFTNTNLSNFGNVYFGRRSEHVLHLSLRNPTYKLRRFSLRVNTIGSEHSDVVDGLDVLFSATDETERAEQLNRAVILVGAKSTSTMAVQIVVKSREVCPSQPLFFAIICYETKNSDEVQSVECVAEAAVCQLAGAGDTLNRVPSSLDTPPMFSKSSYGIERTSFDMGTVLPGLTSSCCLPIKNLYVAEIQFVLRVVGGGSGWVSMSPKQGKIAPGETGTVDITLTAFDEKPSRAEISVALHPTRSQSESQTVTIDVFSKAAAVPQLSVSPLNQFGVLNLGVGGVDSSKKFAVSKMVTVENLAAKMLFVYVSSNLRSQLCFFTNKELSEEVLEKDCLRIEAFSSYKLWVALAPRLSSSHLQLGTSCSIEGGITFSVASGVTSRVTIKFKARVGSSTIYVNPAIVDLGAVKSLPATLRGSFSVINSSAGMDTNFRFSVGSKTIRIASMIGTLSSNSSLRTPITVACTAFGFYSEKVMVHNARSPAASACVDVCWFADSGVIWCTETEKDSKKSMETTPPLSVYLHRSPNGVWSTSESTELTITCKLTDRRLESRHLIPMCNSQSLEAHVRSQKNNSSAVESTRRYTSGILEQCGPSLVLYGRSEVKIRLRGKSPNLEFSKQEQDDLTSTRRVSHYYFFALASIRRDGVRPSSILKVLKVPILYCVSKLVVQATDAGYLGFRTEWRKVQVPLVLENPTALPLKCDINRDELPIALEGPQSLDWDIPAFGSLNVPFALDPRKLHGTPPGSVEIGVKVRNRMNEVSGGAKWWIRGILSSPRIEIDRVSVGKQGEMSLVIPPIVLPSSQDASATFRLRNTTEDSSLRVESEYIPAPSNPWSAIFNIAVSEPSFAIGPGETHSVRVLLSRHPGGCTPSAVRAAFDKLDLNPEGVVVVGKVRIQVVGGESGYPAREISIRVQPRHGPSVLCSPNLLTFESTLADTDTKEEFLSVRNQWSTTPTLFFSEVVGVPDGVFLDVFPSSGSIPPDGHRRVTIGIRRDPAVISAVSFVGAVDFFEHEENDTKQLKRPLASVVIEADLSDCRNDDPEDSKSPSDVATRSPAANELKRRTSARAGPSAGSGAPARSAITEVPKLRVKGCKSIVDRGLQYEVDVGQLTLGTNACERVVAIESTNADIPLAYSVQCTDYRQQNGSGVDERPSWVTLNRNGGVLDETRPSHNLMIKFHPFAVNVYTSYLLVENKQDPSDLKIVRLFMEVVADCSDKDKVGDYFSLTVSGLRNKDGSIYYPHALIGHLDRNTSILVRNHSEVSMEFSLTHDLGRAAVSQLYFSTTYDTLRRITAISVPSKESRRVYIYFRPGIEAEEESQAEQGKGIGSGFRLQRSLKIHVNCRLIKDYQETIMLHSQCRMPQVEISLTKLDFNVDVNDAAPWDKVIPMQHSITMGNQFAEPLMYSVRNSCSFFIVEDTLSNTEIVASKSSHNLILRANPTALKAGWDFLIQEKCIEEHLTIYNRNCPWESFCIRVRLSVGYSSELSVSSQLRGRGPAGLEALVGSFVQRFGLFWSRYKFVTDEELFLQRRRPASGDVLEGFVDMAGLDQWFMRLVESEVDPTYSELMLEMHHVTNELVYYEQESLSGVQELARMLFGYAFNQNVFVSWSLLKTISATNKVNVPHLENASALLGRWVEHLERYLSCVPDSAPHFRRLCQLDNELAK